MSCCKVVKDCIEEINKEYVEYLSQYDKKTQEIIHACVRAASLEFLAPGLGISLIKAKNAVNHKKVKQK